jgi:hypothetical protein
LNPIVDIISAVIQPFIASHRLPVTGFFYVIVIARNAFWISILKHFPLKFAAGKNDKQDERAKRIFPGNGASWAVPIAKK